ncbi:MAG: EAL domain-containing protein [Thiolinea sp.]
MSQHALNCLVIQRNDHGHRKLEAALRRSEFALSCRHVRNSAELEKYLAALPELVFCPDSVSEAQKKKLQQFLYQLAPDCIVVYYSDRQWRGLASENGVQVATLMTGEPDYLQQQLHYLLSYARLRTEFRHCKHLLRIVEQRSQWLVDYAREAVAYISRNQHLYVNAAYLSLFGFESEIDALGLTVLKLISARHHKTFLSLSLETEQKISLPNKFLLDMKTVQGKLFRAEVRFIPSVFRGQRCVQLHVHPLLDIAADKSVTEKQADARNPWKVRIPEVKQKTRQSPVKKSPQPVTVPKKAVAFREDLLELLNLRGSEQSALFVMQPYLRQGRNKISYRQLIRRFNPEQRYKLDSWGIKAAVRYLAKRDSHPLEHRLLVAMGDWWLQDKKRIAQLIRFLQRTRKVNSGLVLSVNAETALRYQDRSVRTLLLLKQTGVRLALDQVSQHTPALVTLLENTQAEFIRTHESLIRPFERSGAELSENLQQLLQQAEGAAYALVVDGVRDVNMMNVLCETNAAYLQGEVLDKFKR